MSHEDIVVKQNKNKNALWRFLLVMHILLVSQLIIISYYHKLHVTMCQKNSLIMLLPIFSRHTWNLALSNASFKKIAYSFHNHCFWISCILYLTQNDEEFWIRFGGINMNSWDEDMFVCFQDNDNELVDQWADDLRTLVWNFDD